MPISTSPKGVKIIGLVIACILVLSAIWYHDSDAVCRLSRGQFCLDQHQPLEVVHNRYAFKHRNVAFSTTFVLHFDVWLAVTWTLQRVWKLQGVEGGSMQAYAQTPYAHGFQEISDQLGLYYGSVKDYQAIIADLKANEGDGGIDMVILGTAIYDLPHYGKGLVEAWDARDDAHKFAVVGIVHDAADTAWLELFAPLARRGALRLLPISDHVTRALQGFLKTFAASPDPVFRSAGYEHVLVDTHVPILNISTPTRHHLGRLSNAVIQGTFDPSVRGFDRIFQDLVRAIHDDPQLWGYITPAYDSPSFVEDKDVADPFKLHIVGHGWLDRPVELKNIVVFHDNLGYSEFYDTMASMDVCMPAFHHDGPYYSRKASSTVVMCSQVNTPMLVTQRFRDSYSYLDDDRVLVTHPAAMSEIDAIKALRTGDASDFLASDPSGSGFTMGTHSAVRHAVEDMLRKGWVRPKSGFDEWKQDVWAKNDDALTRILSDM
ncbi:hypothetical protein FIBSPDRAFT_815775 [Athelia psychrophila]|uniref:Glycosyltransferase family 1 protein n=1 Tax=Athelia psychrophila TaxID=1759441 RepID=A0A166SPD6_9AGAM|nr:hypothetical protein FIBSPDRAFT_815775 [Fibularhizoctonia sp. CBS 109695]